MKTVLRLIFLPFIAFGLWLYVLYVTTRLLFVPASIKCQGGNTEAEERWN